MSRFTKRLVTCNITINRKFVTRLSSNHSTGNIATPPLPNLNRFYIKFNVWKLLVKFLPLKVYEKLKNIYFETINLIK